MGKQSPKIKPGEQPGRVNSSNWKRVSSGNPGGFEKTQGDKGRSFKEMCGVHESQELQENKGNIIPVVSSRISGLMKKKTGAGDSSPEQRGSAEGSLQAADLPEEAAQGSHLGGEEGKGTPRRGKTREAGEFHV